MQCYILLGRKKPDKDGNVSPVENLYTGPSGVELAEKAKEAASTNEYATLERVNNPSGIRLAIDPTEVTSSGTQFLTPPRRLPVSVEAPKPDPESKLEKVQDAERKRRSRYFPVTEKKTESKSEKQ